MALLRAWRFAYGLVRVVEEQMAGRVLGRALGRKEAEFEAGGVADAERFGER